MSKSFFLAAIIFLSILSVTIFYMTSSNKMFTPSSLLSPPTASLVYTNVGDSFQYQSYVWISIQQSRNLNPNTKIYLVLSRKAYEDPTVKEKIKKLNIVPFFYDDEKVQSDPLIRKFNEKFFIKGNMFPKDGNQNFVRFTTERLLFVYAIMKYEKLENVFEVISFWIIF